MNTLRKVIKHPFTLNVGVYGTLFSSAEICNQMFAKKMNKGKQKDELVAQNNSIDWQSVGRYGVYGTVFLAPTLFVWYRYLDKIFPGKATKTIVKKVLMDQFCFGLPCLGVFFTVMNIFEGKENPFEGVPEKWRNAFLLGFCYWVPGQAVNFFLLNPKYRVMYVGCLSFVWTNILIRFRR